MSRRRKWRSSSPDRGWILGQTAGSLTFPAGDPQWHSSFLTLFDFADIDPEALTGRIEQDKSDWFIKRMILNVAAVAELDGLQGNDVMRLWEWGVGSIAVDAANEIIANDPPVIGPEVANLWARQFQTAVMPAYHQPILPYMVSQPANEFALAVDTPTAPGDMAGWTLTALPWGPAFRTFDFTVSNAGLRNNQAVGIAIAQCPAPSGYSWDESDVLRFSFHYQVLLQKRRGG